MTEKDFSYSNNKQAETISRFTCQELEEFFQNEVAQFPGKVAYLYADMVSGQLHFEKHSSEQAVSASMIKVPIMLCLFRLIEEGEISLSTELYVGEEQLLEDSVVFEYGPRKASILELVVWMIVNSDNTATNVLITYLGMDRLNAYFIELGLSRTRVERLMLDYQAIKDGKNNRMSLSDFYHCMRYLCANEADHEFAVLAIRIMKQNRDYESLCRYLYEGPVVAHKTGGLEGIVHDAGVIYTASGSYFLGVFISEFTPSPELEKEAQKLIGRLSRKVYEFETLGNA